MLRNLQRVYDCNEIRPKNIRPEPNTTTWSEIRRADTLPPYQASTNARPGFKLNQIASFMLQGSELWCTSTKRFEGTYYLHLQGTNKGGGNTSHRDADTHLPHYTSS